MPGLDRYPDDLFAVIRELTARVEQLEAQLRQRAPLTTASQGWKMTDMAIPSVGPGEIQIGSNGGELFVATESGTKRLNQLNVPVATPPYPASFTSPATIGSAPTAQNYNDLRADVVNQLFTPLRDVINKGASIGLWPAP
ncbi:hypothetical protein [Nonomuraea bangladeshensis]|uniref:hypothetical protein n=1 Tax=Nonomuraea bangladeshensis TaxID=404385 RepID=UPI003C300CC4